MWSAQSQTSKLGEVDRVVPLDTLYYFDGPCIFTARLGLVDCLFQKVDEGKDVDLFLVTLAGQRVIDALRQGTLSMRGAMQFQDRVWFVELDRRLNIKKTWETHWAQIPDEYKPDPGVGLVAAAVDAADSIEQASSYFSVRFAGQDLTQRTIPLGTLKGLVDDVYDAFRRIFPAPAVDQRALSRSLDFKVFQPRFASLIIAMDEPTVDLQSMKKEVRDKVDMKAVNQTFDDSRKDFFDNMTHIVRQADKGELRAGFAVEHFMTLYQVNDLMPTERGDIASVEFRASATQNASLVHVDDRIGDRIRSAYRLAERTKRKMRGTIVEVNKPSETFVIANTLHRQTTCKLQPGIFKKLGPSVGMKVKVEGLFSTRTRRDQLLVDGLPEII